MVGIPLESFFHYLQLCHKEFCLKCNPDLLRIFIFNKSEKKYFAFWKIIFSRSKSKNKYGICTTKLKRISWGFRKKLGTVVLIGPFFIKNGPQSKKNDKMFENFDFDGA